MGRYTTLALVGASFACGAWVASSKPKLQLAPSVPIAHAATIANPQVSRAEPPKSILICGIKDHPCIAYSVSFHPPTSNYAVGPGEGLTDYDAKTITIGYSKDPFQNVQALTHEVYHAALHERGFKDTEKWQLHAWIYFSEGSFSMVLHDNPDLLHYIENAY